MHHSVSAYTLAPPLIERATTWNGGLPYSHRTLHTMSRYRCGDLLPATTPRIFPTPPAPSARNLHHFHPRLYEFCAPLGSFSHVRAIHM